VITLEPTFLVVNTETLSMYMNENINSLMDSMPLSDLTVTLLDSTHSSSSSSPSTPNYLTCLTLSLNKSPSHEILCLESKMAAKNWVDAI